MDLRTALSNQHRNCEQLWEERCSLGPCVHAGVALCPSQGQEQGVAGPEA